MREGLLHSHPRTAGYDPRLIVKSSDRRFELLDADLQVLT
jgi:hypothetical protein